MHTVPEPIDVFDHPDDDDIPRPRIFRDDGMVILNARSWCYRPEQWIRYYHVNTVRDA
jgi:hypothetical protein